ncbi:MAG: gfo/Idh/MocA family oxidoreductase, partial [Thermoprotei archaeon]
MRIGLIEVSHWHSGMYINALLDLGEDIVAISDRSEVIAKRIAKELK